MSPTTCPRCGAPVSARALTCALCDAVLRTESAPRGVAVTNALARANRRKGGGGGRLVRRVALLLFLVTLAGAAAVTGYAGWSARRVTQRADLERSSSAEMLERQRAAWPVFERRLRRAAGVEGRPGAPDLAAGRALLAAGMTAGRGREADAARYDPLEIDSAAPGRVGDADPAAHGSPRPIGRLLRAGVPVPLPDSLRDRLASDTLARWLPTWRAVGASAAYTPAWMYRSGMPGVSSPHAIPQPSLSVLQALAANNAAAALLAAERDGVAAERYARENLAVAYAFVRSPAMVTQFVARSLAEEGALLLAHVGRVRGDTALVAEADSLGAAIVALKGRYLSHGLAPLARRGDDARLLPIVADTLLSPAMRVGAAATVMVASCQSTREVLLGPDARRRDLLRAASARLADMDPEGRVRPMLERDHEAWRAGSDAFGATAPFDDAPALRVLALLGLHGVAGRVGLCRLLQ